MLGIFRDVGNFYRCRLQIPLNFLVGNSGKFTDKGPFMSAEQCQSSRRNDRLKNQKDFGEDW